MTIWLLIFAGLKAAFASRLAPTGFCDRHRTPVGASLLAMRPSAPAEIYRSCKASARARIIGLSR
ncbi:hypothetical protein EAH72_26345 [Pseudomonas caspiana]|nr:hypothetical protein EAH72_26345 [Pseudomonas caspiana]